MVKRKYGNRLLSVIVAFSIVFATTLGTISLTVRSSDGELPEAASAVYMTNTDYSEIEFSNYGANLIPDSTVSQFNEDGTYKSYYDLDTDSTGGAVLDSNAWWDKAGNRYQYFFNNSNAYGSMNKLGYCSNDSTQSHTNDGSGALYVPKGKQLYLPLPELEAKSYYVVTAWINPSKGTTLTTTIRNSGIQEVSKKMVWANAGWQRICWIYYTGADQQKEAILQVYSDDAAYMDEIAVYKLEASYAQSCIANGKLETYLPNDPQVKQITYDSNNIAYDYSTFDWNMLGENFITDPTVSQFDEDGTYKSYYDLDTDSTGGAVLNPSAWWGKAANRYQYFFNNSNAYGSMKSLGYLSNDSSLSHTADGSGVISIPKQVNRYLPLPQLEAKSYYLITAWINPSKSTTLTTRIFNSNIQEVSKKMVWANAGWQRVTWLYYTGADQQKEAIFGVYGDDRLYIDDLAVYKLDSAFGSKCMTAGKLVYESLSAAETNSVEGFDYSSEDNLFAEGSFEETGTAVDTGAKYGQKVLNVTADNNTVDLEELGENTYYILSYWLKTDAADPISVAIKTGGVTYPHSVGSASEWKKETLIIYTGDNTDTIIEFDSSVTAQGKYVYVDGISVIELPEDVAKACSALDKYAEGSTDLNKLETAKSAFGKEIDYDSAKFKIWRDLNSPIKNGSSYVSLYENYYAEYVRQDKISRGFSPSGYGERRYYTGYTCEAENNLIANSACDDTTYWVDASGYATVTSEKSYEGNTSLKFSGNGTYRKTITGLKANTWYYLSLYGMSDSSEGITDINFGIADTEGRPFENPISTYETSHYMRNNASKQEITILCPDGTWYNRTYCFYTEENTSVDFFVTGTKGTMYLDDIRLYEKANAIKTQTNASYDDIMVYEYEEENFVCDESKNLITNGLFDNGTQFWGNFNGINKFAEVVTSEGNKMLHYKSSGMCYYYMANAQIEAGKEYTFSFWTMNLNGEGAKFGIASLDNPRAFISEVCNVSDDYGVWKLVSIRFKADTSSTVCLAIYDNGGEAVFDKVRLFESSNGYSIALKDDVPVGGTVFTDSVLGSDGLQQTSNNESNNTGNNSNTNIGSNNSGTSYNYSGNSQYVSDADESEDENGVTTEEVVTKVRQKVKKPSTAKTGIATWAIVLIVVGGVAVVGAAAGVTVFLVKRKKRKI